MSTAELRKKVHEFINDSDERMLRVVYAMLQAYQSEAELGTSVEEYNNEIDEAMARMDTGEYYTQDEAKEILKKK
jgi:hypothetical protein